MDKSVSWALALIGGLMLLLAVGIVSVTANVDNTTSVSTAENQQSDAEYEAWFELGCSVTHQEFLYEDRGLLACVQARLTDDMSVSWSSRDLRSCLRATGTDEALARCLLRAEATG